MKNCENLQGTMAAAFYGEASEDERAELDAHLATCSDCRAEYEALGKLVRSIPRTELPIDADLLPELRRRITVVPLWRRREAYAVAAACIAVAFVVASLGPAREPETVAPQTTVKALPELSPAQAALARASSYESERNYAAAYKTLMDAEEGNADAADMGGVRLRMAELAFERLQMYKQAHKHYEDVAVKHNELFRNAPENGYRLEILAEAAAVDYDSLYGLDAARRYGVDGLETYENVLAKYPGTFVASIAAAEMADAVRQRDGLGSDETLVAMETALEGCEHPLAIAQLKIELAHLYRVNDNNVERARTLYNEVLAVENPVLAQAARSSLNEMDSGARSQ